MSEIQENDLMSDKEGFRIDKFVGTLRAFLELINESTKYMNDKDVVEVKMNLKKWKKETKKP